MTSRSTRHSSLLPARPPPRSTLFPYTTLFRSADTAEVTGESPNELRLQHGEADVDEQADERPAKCRERSHDGDEINEDERSEEHTSELQSRRDLVCRLLLEKKKINMIFTVTDQ